jgi:hypothetical protein
MNIFIYLTWFFFLYFVPAIIFLRISTIIPEIIELKELDILIKFDKKKNVKSVTSNFDEFIEKYPELKKNNIWISLLKIMCADAEEMKKHNPNVYLLKYKNIFTGIFSIISLSSFIPLIITELTGKNEIYDIILLHSICLFFVFLLYRLLCHRYENFKIIFYKYWYNKILNFDLLSVKEISSHILNSSENTDLLSAVNTLAETDQKMTDILTIGTKDMSEKLAEFIELQKNGEGITYQNITEALDVNIKQIIEIGSIYENISEKIDNSLDHLLNITKKNKPEIKAINENTELLHEIKKLFSTYKSENLAVEVLHLQKTADSLGENIKNAFTSLEMQVSANLNKITASYDNFYEICNGLTRAITENNNIKLHEAINSINEKYILEFDKFNKQSILLENAIKETSDSTQKICEYLFNISQSEDLSSNTEGLVELKRMIENVVTYQDIIKIYEHKYNASYADKIKKLNGLLFKAVSDIEEIKRNQLLIEEKLSKMDGN